MKLVGARALGAALATVAALAGAEGADGADGAVRGAAEPPVPPSPAASFRPDAVRVALVDSGVDYTLAPVRDALLRHEGGPADGTIVGIDFRDLDHRPFDAWDVGGGRVARHGTRVASVLLREAPGVALVPYRYPGQDMRLMHALVEHAAAHGVRAMGLPLGSDREAQWAAFERAARAHPEILFVASAGNDGRDLDARPLYPASLALENLLVVTSADDFGGPSPESGTGRGAVDYLVFAEAVPVMRFGGEPGVAAGSSYAVPRALALLARTLAREPSLSTSELAARVRASHANGLRPRDVAEGLVIDPLADTVGPIETAETIGARSLRDAVADATAGVAPPARIEVPVDAFALDAGWTDRRIGEALAGAARILARCDLALVPARVERPRLDGAAAYLRDLEPGAAATLFDRLGRGGPDRPVAAVFARDTRMATPFDAEAFGRANTRGRPWLADSVWMTAALGDEAAALAHEAIALAHELWHVLANSGAHVADEGNLMLARTTGTNTALTPAQCAEAREGALARGLGRAGG